MKKRHIPRKFVYLIAFLSIFIIIIPIYYIVTYTSNRVSDNDLLTTVFGENDKPTDIVYYDYDNFDKMEITLKCTDFNIESKKATYKVALIKETYDGNVSNMSFRVGMKANWVGLNEASSSVTVNTTTTNFSTGSATVSNLDPVITRSNFMIPFPKPKTYLYLTYTVTDNGKSTTYNTCLKYNYGDYLIEKGGYAK